MSHITQIKSLLAQAILIPLQKRTIFYKTGIGHYAEHDRFMGVNVPTLRKIAKDFYTLSIVDIQYLLNSPINEERLLALLILIRQYQTSNEKIQEKLYQFYIKNLTQVNNWNLVDASAHLIIGNHLFKRDKSILIKLASSPNLWQRRIAIVATWYFIKQTQVDETFKIATILLHDTHDLIHKAVGWMLREAGKHDAKALHNFLDHYTTQMPRTMLRYTIEKLSVEQKTYYLKLKK